MAEDHYAKALEHLRTGEEVLTLLPLDGLVASGDDQYWLLQTQAAQAFLLAASVRFQMALLSDVAAPRLTMAPEEET